MWFDWILKFQKWWPEVGLQAGSWLTDLICEQRVGNKVQSVWQTRKRWVFKFIIYIAGRKGILASKEVYWAVWLEMSYEWKIYSKWSGWSSLFCSDGGDTLFFFPLQGQIHIFFLLPQRQSCLLGSPSGRALGVQGPATGSRACTSVGKTVPRHCSLLGLLLLCFWLLWSNTHGNRPQCCWLPDWFCYWFQ